MSEKQNNSLG